MSYQEIIKKIKQKDFAKIYFLHGEEPFFIDKITDAIIENAMEEHERDFNQSIHYGKDAEAPRLIAEAKEFPMMGERRLVVLKEAQDFRGIEDLTPYFSHPADQTIFVVNYKYKKFDARKKSIKAAAKNGVVFNSEKVKDYKLPDWVSAQVKSTGYSITPKATMLLVEFLGSDLSKIVNELDKLSILVEKGTTINEVHIEENIGISKDYNVFELINAVGAGNVAKANRIVDYFVHNPKAGNLIPIISSLFNHFSRLMRIHFLPNKTNQAIASALRVHPFVGGELLSSSRIYNPKKIARNIAVLHEYDLKSKGVGNASFSHGELLKELIYRLMH